MTQIDSVDRGWRQGRCPQRLKTVEIILQNGVDSPDTIGLSWASFYTQCPDTALKS